MAIRFASHRFFWRFSLLVGVFLILVLGFYQYTYGTNLSRIQLPFNIHQHSGSSNDFQPSDPDRILPAHPIDDLIRAADTKFKDLIGTEQTDVRGAANAYRSRRGRHPPPNFGDWVAFAKEKNARLIEELFDQIYDDLEPFWAVSPDQLQSSITGMEYIVSVRNGSAQTIASVEGDVNIQMGVWKSMLQLLEKRLPDVDMALNVVNEPRLLVPFDIIAGYMKTAVVKGKPSRNGSWPTISEFKSLDPFESASFDHSWITSGNYWALARDTCPPGSEAARTGAVFDFSQPPDFPTSYPNGSHHGYVGNWTLAKDPCSHTHLRGLHGTFVGPTSMKTSKDLFPVFSSSKLTMNNDILLPPPISWTEADSPDQEAEPNWWQQFAGGDGGPTRKPWNSKHEEAFWRGPATGGINKPDTWTHFHRHRLLSMMNSTQVRQAENHVFDPQNFPLPHADRPYDFAASFNTTLSSWVSTFANGAFTDLKCFKENEDDQPSCEYSSEYYKIADDPGTAKQFEYKYLPDVDGDTLSPKFLSLLRSTSLPIKATIYKEWHDSRLIPWKHFVPMDNTFVDFWPIMDYFLAGRDAKAEKIAEEGRKWADTVLRQNDMLVYIYRLLLEYARVMDKDRENMGFVGDLRRR